jgi:hypothetical protein
MKHCLFRLALTILLVGTLSWFGYGQGGGMTSSITGTVVDQSGAVIPGAAVVVKNNATSMEFRGSTVANGSFAIPAVPVGNYTVTITAAGFKQAIVENVKVDAGTPANITSTLQIGNPKETIVVVGGADIVQTSSANIATSMTVNQIANLPLATRNALDFVVFLPGVDTAGITRNATFMGLPQAAVNITIDGVSAQDNYNKSTEFFVRVSPRLDAVEEVTVSTATPGAESAGQGAIQIRFTTRQGSNDFHGSLYEYHRNQVFNSNYWFNNRDQAPTYNGTSALCTPQQLASEWDKCKAPRDPVKLNQFGGRLGGPILFPGLFNGRDKALFFFNFEEFRQPNAIARQRTIFNPLTQQGTFQYNVTVGGQTQVRQVDLLQLAAANGQTSTIDPVIGKLLADIRNSTTLTGGVQQLSDPNLQRFTFTNTGLVINHFPTARFDFNLTSKHHLELTYNYTKNIRTPDILNSNDPAFPGFPNRGAYVSHRFVGGIAVRSTLKPTLVNELRLGLSGGSSLFRPELSAGQYSGTLANQAGFALGISAAGITNAYVTNAPSRRNTPTRVIEETLSWVRGTHNVSFGGAFTNIGLWTWSKGYVVPTITFSVNSNDPAIGMFNTTNFPGAASADLTRAQNIYAVLTGRVTAVNGNAYLDETTNQYAYLGARTNRGRMREMGLFAQDSWRIKPNLTLTLGLRYELQFPFVPLNDSYTTAEISDLYGISGPGNLFKPGVMTGRETQFILYKKGVKAYNLDTQNFAPSFGFAWTPRSSNRWLSRILGAGGRTVVRGGYSIAYNRYGMAEIQSLFSSNPGSFVNATRSMTLGNLVTNVGSDTLPVLLRETSRLGAASFPTAPSFPMTGAVTNSVNIYDPNLHTPYTQSWSFGVQREITKDTVVEARYVGTRNLAGQTTYNLNETNIVENGLLSEFKLAMANLQANIAAGRGSNFKYYGTNTGTSPLPITLAYFSGLPATQASDQSKYTSTLFSSTTFVSPLAQMNPNPYTFADNLWSDATRRANALAAGLPANFFLVNPGLTGGANYTGNGGYSRYDSMQVELRRRLSKGLLVQSSYVWAKGFSSSRVSFRAARVNTLGSTLAHAFKINWVYELPFGPGKMMFANSGRLMNVLIGGWEFHGTGRIQSGQRLDFGNVRLVGMTRKDLQQLYGLNFDDAGRIIYALPKDIIDNTIKAFSVSATSTTGYGALGVPTGRYIAPANSANCIEVYDGQCAPVETVVDGPMFTRFDLSVIKRVRITERTSFELRGEFLNALNNTNFYGATCASSSATCGQVTSAYRDVSNSQDPGGRLIQLVARINF